MTYIEATDRTYEETDIPINPEDPEDEQGNG